MGQIEWSIKDGKLVAWLSWQQDNETSTGTGGVSTSFSQTLTDLGNTAKELLSKIGKTYNLRAFNGADDWSKLV